MTQDEKKVFYGCGAAIVLILLTFAGDYGLWNLWNAFGSQVGLNIVTFWTFLAIMILGINTNNLIKWSLKQLFRA